MDRIEGGKIRFKNRVARLNRLVELDAPVGILAREVAMVLDSLYLIDAKTVGEAVADVHEGHVRRASNYCNVSDCTSAAIKGDVLCDEHLKEAEQPSPLDALLDDAEEEADEENN